jgi:AAHS family 4-hydroxybenzoate transporter-like MFS transporter
VSRPTLDVDQFIDERAVSGFQKLVLALCGAACFCAGFNLLAPGYLAPAISRELNLGPGVIGALFVIGGFGTVLGTLTCGPLADRFGRKTVVAATLFAAVPFLALAGMARGLTQLAVGEFAGDFALMGMVPVAMALAGEYVPRRLKTTLVMLVFAGFALGTIASGVMAAGLLAGWGWHGVLLIGAALPLLALTCVVPWLPESLDALTARVGAGMRISSILRRIDPKVELPVGVEFAMAEPLETGFPVTPLFRDGWAVPTFLLWIMFFANMLTLFSMNMWLPTILHDAAIAERTAIIISALMSLGGILGGIGLAELCDRLRSRRFIVLGLAYLAGGALVAAIGWSGNSLWELAIIVMLAGFFNYGVQNAANSMVAVLYPITARSTGAAWSMGVGQSAQVVGPFVSALLVALRWHERPTLVVIALPTVFAGLAAGILAARGLPARNEKVHGLPPSLHDRPGNSEDR